MRNRISERRRRKSFVIIDMIMILVTGGMINVGETADKENLNSKTISRYIDEINNYIESKRIFVEHGVKVSFDKNIKGYILAKRDKYFLRKEEMYFICKSILVDRNLSKYFKNNMVKKLLFLMDEISANEVYNGIFDEITQKDESEGDKILDKIWMLKWCSLNNYKVEITSNSVKQKIDPLGVVFFKGDKYVVYSEYSNVNIDDTVIYSKKVENIEEIKLLGKKNKRNIGYFNSAEFTRFFNGGEKCELVRIKFIYHGENPELVKREFSTFEYSKNENYYVFHGKTFKEGFVYRIFQFGKDIEVQEPSIIREEIKEFIKNINIIYSK